MTDKPKHIIDTQLSHTLDDKGNAIKGSWDVKLCTDPSKPHGLNPGLYNFLLDYGSRDTKTGKEEAYQFAGKLVVGKYPIIKVDPVLVPWEIPDGVEPDKLSSLSKRNQTFDVLVKTLDPDDNTGIEHLPLNCAFLRDRFEDYGKHNTTQMYKDKEQAVSVEPWKTFKTHGTGDISNIEPHKGIPIPSTSYGMRKLLDIKVGDLFKPGEPIKENNTIFIWCAGTTDRSSDDNYIPFLVAAPLILGERHTYLRVRGLKDSKYDGTDYVCGVRGGGSVAFSIQNFEAFALTRDADNNIVPKYNLESWYTDPSKRVSKGYFTVQEQNDDGAWFDVPENRIQLVTGDTHTKLDGNHIICATSNTEQLQVIVFNDKPMNYDGEYNIKLCYHGVPGEYCDNTTDAFKIEVKPTNKTYNPIDIVMTINGIGAGNLYGLFNVLQYLDLEFLTQTGVNCGLDGVLILTITEI